MKQLSAKNDHSYDVSNTHQNLLIFLAISDYNSKTDVFRDFISLMINHREPRRPKNASGRHKVSASRSASKRSALVYM